MSHTDFPQLTLLIEDRPEPVRNVTSFFARFQNAVEILPYSQETLSQKIGESRGKLIFMLDPELRVPLVEVLKFSSEFETDPNLLFLAGERSARTPGLKNQPPFSKSDLWGAKRLGARALSDPLCPFFAFRSEIKTLWPRSRLKAQEFCLSLPPDRQKVLSVQGRPPRLGVWQATKVSLELRRLARRFSSAVE